MIHPVPGRSTSVFFISVLIILTGSVVKGQTFETFAIKSKNPLTDLTPYVIALQKADMTSDRFLDKRRLFHFTDGPEVELFSANELTAKGIKVDLDRLCSKKETDPDPVFSLSESGYILKGYPSHGKVSNSGK